MHLIFLYGQPASGKLTVGRELAARTGLPLFHNHLVVDAVGALFPFGSASFVALREAFWLRAMGEAARQGQSFIFTFAPEPTVAADFPARVEQLVRDAGGRVTYVALDVTPEQQMQRLAAPSRGAFGKLQSQALLVQLREDFARAMAQMPRADLVIDTETVTPAEAARQIEALIAG